MKKSKVLSLDVIKSGKVVFSTPFGSPDLVIGFLSTFNVPENAEMHLDIYLKDVDVDIYLKDVDVSDEKENN